MNRASEPSGISSPCCIILKTRDLLCTGTAARQVTWTASGRKVQIASKSLWISVWVTHTRVMAGTASKISRAFLKDTHRGEAE
jgi:hypothetical protein